MKFVVTTAMFLASLAGLANAAEPRPEAKLVGVRKIWDQAPHNAFTDLIRFEDRWFCVFREGQTHVSPDGSLRVISSVDGDEWKSAALLTSATADLRDAKINRLPDGRLMLSGAAAWHKPKPATHQTLAWFSDDGQKWSEPIEIGEPDCWLWRTAWHEGQGYGVGYGVNKANRRVRLYSSDDGRVWDTLVGDLFDRDYPNESALLFNDDGSCLCLLRRDAGSRTAQLGHASPPYAEWHWRDL
ncbi:MAG TPA: sialidase family protein, partial [Pirellulales bacterium]|nr:sialidase family protein [Pirellulales bacterium]